MLIYRYCESLMVFFIMKTQFYKSAFIPDSDLCSNKSDTLTNAYKLYLYTENNNWFINEMKKGCKMGGNDTKCHIKNLDVNDILQDFNNSYYEYIQNPAILCVPFSEFTNNLESLFITGGCYLEKTNKQICNISNKGFSC